MPCSAAIVWATSRGSVGSKTTLPNGPARSPPCFPRAAVAQRNEHVRRCHAASRYLNQAVRRRQRTHWVGLRGVARQVKSLATAPPKVDRAALAALARLRHPVFTTKSLETCRFKPD